MKNFVVIRYLILLRSSYWFIPMIMIASAILLAMAVIQADELNYNPDSILFNWIRSMGPDGARAVFTIIAGSTITVAGTIFSIAMVVLVMASSQFGPRLIPTFMRVGKIQFGIGLFVGTFVYCLLLLTFVPEQSNGENMPVWGVLTGVILGIVAFLVLIMLIHEIATFIQAPVVTQRVSKDIIETFERVFPEKGRESNDDQEVEPPLDSPSDIERANAMPLAAESRGYVLTMNYADMVTLAQQHHCVVHLKIRPGEYAVEGQVIAMVDGSAANDRKFCKQFASTVKFGPDRSLTQDARYAIDQMVEIAVRALSPGINDPFTAINCVDKLSGALAHLVDRRTAVQYSLDSDDILRVVSVPDTYQGIVESAFGQIRHNAAGTPVVLIRIVEAIGRLAMLDLHPDFSRALYDQLLVSGETRVGDFRFKHDYKIFNQRYQETLGLFDFTNVVISTT